MEIMQFKFVYLAYSESLSREKFFCGRTKYEKDAFRLKSRDDSLETLLMYMGGWHRVSNKNQPNISSIKFLKNRDFFYSRTTTTSIESFVELSPSSTSPIERVWNCLPRLHHLSKGCGIVSVVYITYRKGVFKKIRLVKLFLRVF